MCCSNFDINVICNIILESQHWLHKSSDSIESIYVILWNRKRDFKADQLDVAAYKEFKVVETWTFKRNMYFVPSEEYSLYRCASKGIIRWGESDESWLKKGDCPDVQAAEKELKERLLEFDGLTLNHIWDILNLSYE